MRQTIVAVFWGRAPGAGDALSKGWRLEYFQNGDGQHSIRKGSSMLARSPLLLCFVACLCVLSFFTGAVARGQSAQIAGSITDPSKAAIQNASLEVIDS